MALTDSEKKERLDWLLPVVRQAGDILLKYYKDQPEIDWKTPNEPVTEADHASNAFILEQLTRHFPDDAIISEEAKAIDSRFERPLVWYVDPMDGTKEFIGRNGEFSVMVGLTENGRPALGAVFQPTSNRLYLGAAGVEAFRVDGKTRQPLQVSQRRRIGDFRMVISRSHAEPLVEEIGRSLGIGHVLKSGSVGVKCGLIASGSCELYVHPSPHTKLWDSCGPQAILEAAGGVITDLYGEPLDYLQPEIRNKRGMVVSNGVAHQEIIARIQPLVQAR